MFKTSHESVRDPLRVGLVNNMPDGVLGRTERQFRDLLRAAAPSRTLELVLFQIPEIARGDALQARMSGRYLCADRIADAGLDALIVTGANPSAASLSDEPFWPAFTRLVDLTLEAQLPTVWSCLAAHAAVLHLDGVQRRPLSQKASGVYPCAPAPAAANNPLLRHIEGAWSAPHSRHNDVREADLIAHGYDILTRSAAVGVDTFVRKGPPLFLFCQGHPEYDRASLALEYKRDFRAYIEGARASPPPLPVNAFDSPMEQALVRLTQAAAERPSLDLLANWPASAGLESEPPLWRAFAIHLYSNWLQISMKSPMESIFPAVRVHADPPPRHPL